LSTTPVHMAAILGECSYRYRNCEDMLNFSMRDNFTMLQAINQAQKYKICVFDRRYI
jgi:hypothetical protein